MSKVIGLVTPEERDAIELLFERKNGLVELSRLLTPDNDELYEKVVKDLGETSLKFDNWWDDMFNKYHWEQQEGYNWEINFQTCEILLTSKE